MALFQSVLLYSHTVLPRAHRDFRALYMSLRSSFSVQDPWVGRGPVPELVGPVTLVLDGQALKPLRHEINKVKTTLDR